MAFDTDHRMVRPCQACTRPTLCPRHACVRRGAITHKQVNGVIRSSRSMLFDMSGPGLAYLAATIARQGYRPPPGYMVLLMEALGPHLDPMQVRRASMPVGINYG